MDGFEMYYCVFMFVVMIVLVTICLCCNRHRKKTRRLDDLVRRCSSTYCRLSLMESGLVRNTRSVPGESVVRVGRKSLQSFRSFNPEAELRKWAKDNLDYVRGISAACMENRRLWSLFESDWNEAMRRRGDVWESDYERSGPSGVSRRKWYRAESHVLQSMLPEIVRDWHVTIVWTYVSPGGRKRYVDSKTYDMQQIDRVLEDLDGLDEERLAKQRERGRMTAKMRYQVLREDGFKCRRCGRGPAEGVTLEVDHIVPVSRGGKTVRENLQTLCHDCNQGKKNRYDE